MTDPKTFLWLLSRDTCFEAPREKPRTHARVFIAKMSEMSIAIFDTADIVSQVQTKRNILSKLFVNTFQKGAKDLAINIH